MSGWPGICPNGPDPETGEWPCDPKGYFGDAECQVCGVTGSWDEIGGRKRTSTLAQVVSAFIVKARDQYGLGRFMPDELPLLDEMARLARIDLDRQALEDDRQARRHVQAGHQLRFTVKRTPPSGRPPPDDSEPAAGLGGRVTTRQEKVLEFVTVAPIVLAEIVRQIEAGQLKGAIGTTQELSRIARELLDEVETA